MLEFYEPGAAIIEDAVASAVARATKAASNEIFDRIRTETHLLSEFASKIAGSHSVKDLRTMCEECGQHQIDFVRRDSERLFKHGERMIETTSNLLNIQSQD
jgi:hypothetical protein